MTNEERAMVTRLRQEGLGYKKIASALSLPVQTVKSWCVRHSIQKEDFCLNCVISKQCISTSVFTAEINFPTTERPQATAPENASRWREERKT